jgi:tRNA pseudouridine38-40 synthase
LTLFDASPGGPQVHPDDVVDDHGAAPGGPLRRAGTEPDDASAVDATPPLSQRVRATVAYDGGSFFGFAAQPGLRTVAGVLNGSLERLFRRAVAVTGAGRTDRGVHAWGQVVSFDAPASADLARVQRSLNRMLSPALVVRDLQAAADGFDARFSARSRRYRYTVLNRVVPDPFLAATAWHVPEPLDLAALRLASDPLVGEHDFACFCRRPRSGRDGEEVSLVRRVLSTGWTAVGDGVLRFEIEANAFCHQMVRSIVGTLVEMGRSAAKRPGSVGPRAGEMLAIIRSGDRAAAGPVAPPHGLCLWEVRYP